MILQKIVLHFPKELVNKPIVCQLAKAYGLEFKILEASVTLKAEGVMIMELKGEQADCKRGIDYLDSSGVRVEKIIQNIFREEEKCTHCGYCVGFCPKDAFEVEALTRRIVFFGERCTGCKLCIKACPSRAMKSYL